jgi:hypothetical protein
LSVLLSAFVSFSPSFKALVETDFQRKAFENSQNHSLKIGQILERSNTFPVSNNTMETFDLRDKGEDGATTINWTQKDYLISNITLVGENISIEIDLEQSN